MFRSTYVFDPREASGYVFVGPAFIARIVARVRKLDTLPAEDYWRQTIRAESEEV
ncbi:hypothetical protein [Amycolatopsis sp.]|uniref:hypothetical protein n=1 Tax=Amycolatopsis sp. TaxID=37632 RepID=UPI002BEFBE56|nr:hypothetical protein [Amycolatopsis sp.]HVV11592.1 hypothetical protein [Amycolatopsis sp.]